MKSKGTVIVTGASQGTGLAIVRGFLLRGYNVVATSRSIPTTALESSANLALVEGDITQESTAVEVVRTAISAFGSIDHLISNAGSFVSRSFVEYTSEDLNHLVDTNLKGFLFLAQLAVKQMLIQQRGGNVTSLTASLADNPNASRRASVAMMTKGALTVAIRSLALEYAKDCIRFNAVAPGIVDTPLQQENDSDVLKSFSPMRTISDPEDIAAAVLYLAEARHVTGEILHVDGGAHVGKW